jgi:hypothetical protein
LLSVFTLWELAACTTSQPQSEQGISEAARTKKEKEGEKGRREKGEGRRKKREREREKTRVSSKKRIACFF